MYNGGIGADFFLAESLVLLLVSRHVNRNGCFWITTGVGTLGRQGLLKTSSSFVVLVYSELAVFDVGDEAAGIRGSLREKMHRAEQDEVVRESF